MKDSARVLDSYGFIAYLNREKGAEQMVQIFRSARDSGLPLLLSAVNWGEIFYVTLRTKGREQARIVARLISDLPIEVIPVHLDWPGRQRNSKPRKRCPTPTASPPPWRNRGR